MNYRPTVSCPYCGIKNITLIGETRPKSRIIWCDVEDGGCDARFVVDFRITISATAKKIEGEGEQL